MYTFINIKILKKHFTKIANFYEKYTRHKINVYHKRIAKPSNAISNHTFLIMLKEANHKNRVQEVKCNIISSTEE